MELSNENIQQKRRKKCEIEPHCVYSTSEGATIFLSVSFIRFIFISCPFDIWCGRFQFTQKNGQLNWVTRHFIAIKVIVPFRKMQAASQNVQTSNQNKKRE